MTFTNDDTFAVYKKHFTILTFFILILINTYLVLLGRLVFLSDGVSKSMADSRPKCPQRRMGHPRIGELQTLSPMYSTRLCCQI